MRVFADFREVVIADAEYHFGGSGSPSGLPIPLCFSALELRSGRRFQLWDTELRRSSPPWSRDHDTLFVAFNAPAELLCYSVLNWPYPILTLDLLAEFRQATNGVLAKDAPRGLLAALQYYGLPHLDLAEKEEWRDLILSGGPFTADQRTGILAYNWTDIEGTQRLLKEMLPRLPANLDPCLYRGRYTAAVARTERIGIPVDAPTWENFLRKRDQVRLEITKDCPVYEKTIFSMGRFGALLKAWQLDHTWPHTAKTGIWSTKDRVFKDFSYHPAVERLRQVRSVVDQLDKPTFEVRHGAQPVSDPAVRAQSGRNATKACIFQSPSWLRAFIQPPPGWALIYADYEQEEFALAGILAQDTAMLTAYGSGDPYVPLAILAGLVPRGGTKHTHPRERGIAKTLALSLLYGAGAPTLQRKAGISLNLRGIYGVRTGNSTRIAESGLTCRLCMDNENGTWIRNSAGGCM